VEKARKKADTLNDTKAGCQKGHAENCIAKEKPNGLMPKGKVGSQNQEKIDD